MHTKRIAIVDEHEVFRRGVGVILSEDPCLAVVQESAAGPLRELADAVVASPSMLRDLNWDGPVVVFWGRSDPPLPPSTAASVTLMERDAVDAEQLLGAVRAIVVGFRVARPTTDPGQTELLDPRCLHILHLLAEGADTRGISESLYYSERTIKGLIRNIEERLSAQSRAEAVAKGIRLGLI